MTWLVLAQVPHQATQCTLGPKRLVQDQVDLAQALPCPEAANFRPDLIRVSSTTNTIVQGHSGLDPYSNSSRTI